MDGGSEVCRELLRTIRQLGEAAQRFDTEAMNQLATRGQALYGRASSQGRRRFGG
jgi:hypothetical protein